MLTLSLFLFLTGTTKTNQRFIFVEKEMSWSDAQRYCRESYTDLASVRDSKENQEIQSLTKNRSVWIGLFRSGKCYIQYISFCVLDGYLQTLF